MIVKYTISTKECLTKHANTNIKSKKYYHHIMGDKPNVMLISTSSTLEKLSHHIVKSPRKSTK
jgi:hypothetical protein